MQRPTPWLEGGGGGATPQIDGDGEDDGATHDNEEEDDGVEHGDGEDDGAASQFDGNRDNATAGHLGSTAMVRAVRMAAAVRKGGGLGAGREGAARDVAAIQKMRRARGGRAVGPSGRLTSWGRTRGSERENDVAFFISGHSLINTNVLPPPSFQIINRVSFI
jgi:hypothetical protein